MAEGTGEFDCNGDEMMVGDIVHFRCRNASLCGKGEVYLAEEPDGFSDRYGLFRIRDTTPGRRLGRIYPYYEDAKYRIDEKIECRIIDGNFVSVWSVSGEVETSCKVKLETHEVFDIKTVEPEDAGIESNIVEYEYVEYGDGKKLHRLPVYKLDDYDNEEEAVLISKEDGSFWRR